jgi:limonene 1,2-monooxygenase
VILELFRSDEPVTRETDWFTIRDGRLQYRPYSDPHPEVAVAAMVTPSGPRMAGEFGVSLLSLSMSVVDGFAAIGQAWGVAEEQAAKHGHTLDRRTWRVLGTMHLAETKEQAIEDCTYGLREFANYFGGGAGFVPLANTVTESSSPRDYVEAYAASGNVVIGTPDDAITYIEDLVEQSGGFGTFLLLAHDWANPEATMKSYRLFAREVAPHFQHLLSGPRTSHEWATEKRAELFGRAGQAMLNAITSHVEEKSAETEEASS